MTSEHRGYSTVLVARVAQLDPRLISVRLAHTCFRHHVSVSEVAHVLGVSRASVYSWFKGLTTPRKSFYPNIEQFIADIDAR